MSVDTSPVLSHNDGMTTPTPTFPNGIISRRRDGIAYLMADGDLSVPCSRYGRCTSDCAPVVWRLAFILARECGDPVTVDDLDSCMGMVVNEHDNVAYIIRQYGRRKYT